MRITKNNISHLKPNTKSVLPAAWHNKTPKQRGYLSHWADVRNAYINAHPLCEMCEAKGIIYPAEIVHHIKPLADGGELADIDNLMSVCRKCHAEVHRGKGE